MPIPDIDESGLLPSGIHDCALEEIGVRFGSFQKTDRRPRLYEQLKAYVQEMRSSGSVVAVVIDGSFVTTSQSPADIDLVLVLSKDHDLTVDPSPMQYNVLSSRQVRARYGFDVFVARETSKEYEEYVEFFQQVRGEPGLRKGVLKVEI